MSKFKPFTIQELEERYPISTREIADALEISKLRANHADLVRKRVEVESKVLMNADFIFEKATGLFESNITDRNTKKILLQGIGIILDQCVASGNTLPPQETQ